MRSKQAYRTSGTWVDRPEAPFGPLGWEDNGDSYSALLPFIPGYPVGYNTVSVMSASASGDDKLESDAGWWFMMFIHTNNDGDVLPVSPVDFGIEDTFPTAEDTMQFIENHLSPESVSQVLEDMDFMPVRDDNGYWLRASRHATQRTASLDLYWDDSDAPVWWLAEILIPGYPGGANLIISPTETYPHNAYFPWDVTCTAFPEQNGGEPVDINCWDLPAFEPMGDSVEDIKQAVEKLSLQDFADALAAKGIEPDEE